MLASDQYNSNLPVVFVSAFDRSVDELHCVCNAQMSALWFTLEMNGVRDEDQTSPG